MGQNTSSYQSWTCNEDNEDLYNGSKSDITDAETKLWEFKNRCTDDPDRISEIRVGFADGFARNGGGTLYAPVWIEL